MREQWNLGDPLTARDAVARSFSDVFTLDTPRDPDTWPNPTPRPVPEFFREDLALGKVVSKIGGDFLTAMRHYAAQHGLDIQGLPKDPDTALPPERVVEAMRGFLATFFPS